MDVITGHGDDIGSMAILIKILDIKQMLKHYSPVVRRWHLQKQQSQCTTILFPGRRGKPHKQVESYAVIIKKNNPVTFF